MLPLSESPAPDAPAPFTAPRGAAARWAEIARSPLNPRKHFDDAAIGELAAEIARDGLMNPITVRPVALAGYDIAPTYLYEIVAGERRHRAIEKLIADGAFPEDAEWPIQIVMFDDTRTLLAAMAENLKRKDLTAWEEAEGFHSLARRGVKPSAMAAGSDIGARAIQKRIKLVTDLPAEAQAALRDGRLKVEMANVIAAAAEAKRATLLDAALSGLLDTEKLKRLATDKLVPVGAQCFALAEYKGDFVEHEAAPGEAPQRWFADTVEVERLVKAHIENEKGRLTAGGAAFVTVKSGWDHDRLPEGWTKPARGKGVAPRNLGALIWVDANNARVTIMEGVAKPEVAPQANPDEPALPFAPPPRAAEPATAPAKATAPEYDIPFLNYVADQAERAIAGAIAERPLIAFDAMLAKLIADAIDGSQDEYLQDALADRLGKAAALREDKLRRHVATLPMTERMALAAIAFYAVDGSPDAVTRELGHAPMLRAECASLVKALDANIAKHWEFYGDDADEFLKACGPAQLKRIAADLKINIDGAWTEDGARRTIAGQAARHRKYLPPWLHLQPAAGRAEEIERAVFVNAPPPTKKAAAPAKPAPAKQAAKPKPAAKQAAKAKPAPKPKAKPTAKKQPNRKGK